MSAYHKIQKYNSIEQPAMQYLSKLVERQCCFLFQKTVNLFSILWHTNKLANYSLTKTIFLDIFISNSYSILSTWLYFYLFVCFHIYLPFYVNNCKILKTSLFKLNISNFIQNKDFVFCINCFQVKFEKLLEYSTRFVL